jgi:hypothetical protein
MTITRPPLGPALASLRRALEFLDKVKASTADERTAVGTDHWKWLESAVRDVIVAAPDDDYLLNLFDAMAKELVEVSLKDTPADVRRAVDKQLVEFREHLEIAS